MSVDTRTPRPGFDEQPALSMAQGGLRSRAGHRQPRQLPGAARTRPARTAARRRSRRAPRGSPPWAAAGRARRRRRPSSGAASPPPATPAPPDSSRPYGTPPRAAPTAYGSYNAYGSEFDDDEVRAPPRSSRASTWTTTQPNPVITAPRQPGRTGNGPLLPPMRQAVGAYDAVDTGPYEPAPYEEEPVRRRRVRRRPSGAGAPRHGADTVRHAYYPGRRMNLGVVLLPLRVFLGFISIYAGMGKLCDPVYFDGGDRGSMVKWLNSLHPWALAEPLRDFALSHPVGAGLSVAFLQVVVGVLTVLGLWQRVAAVRRRAALRRAAGHRQLADRPRLRRARHHLPRRLVPADHRGRPRLLRRRTPRRRGLAQARPALRRSGTCAAACCAAAPSSPPSSSGSHCSSARCSAAPSAPPRSSPCPAPTSTRPTSCPAPRSRRSPPAAQASHTPAGQQAVTVAVQLRHPVRAGVHARCGHRPRGRPGRRRRTAQPDAGHRPGSPRSRRPRSSPRPPAPDRPRPAAPARAAAPPAAVRPTAAPRGSTSGGTSGGGRNPIGGLLG